MLPGANANGAARNVQLGGVVPVLVSEPQTFLSPLLKSVEGKGLSERLCSCAVRNVQRVGSLCFHNISFT